MNGEYVWLCIIRGETNCVYTGGMVCVIEMINRIENNEKSYINGIFIATVNSFPMNMV